MAAPVVLVLLLGGVGVYALSRLKRAAAEILEHHYQTIRSARRVEVALRALERAPTTGNGRAGGGRTVLLLRAEIERALDQCSRNVSEDAERRTLRKASRVWRSVRRKLLGPGGQDLWAGRSATDRLELLGPLFVHMDGLIALNERAMADYDQRSRRVARLLTGAMVLATALVVCTLVILANVAAGRVSAPVLSVVRDLQDALPTDEGLARRVALGNDEVILLRSEMDRLLSRLDRYVDEHRRVRADLQAKLALLMDEIQDGILLLDNERGVITANKVARHVLEMGSGEGAEEAGEALEPRTSVHELLAKVGQGELDPGRSLGDVEKDERAYRPRLLPLDSTSEGREGYMLVLWDVTLDRRFQESRSRFIAMLSHQLKTPITSTSMSINLLSVLGRTLCTNPAVGSCPTP